MVCVFNRELALAYKVYEKDVEACKKEIDLCGKKKHYNLILDPPEIKTGADGEKYVKKGQASYHIT